MEKVERTQYQAALAITVSWQGSSRTKLYEELGWESQSDRRWSRRILQIHKIRNNIRPVYLKEKLPPLRTPMYRITNQNNFREINCKTSRYKNSFFPNAVIIWNKMITDFQDIPSFSSIRAHILSLIRPKIKSTFGIHDHLGLRHLFQSRVHLSPLNQHKNDIILLILLLIFASVNMVSRILIIISLSVHFLLLREQLWQLMPSEFYTITTLTA